jgi:CRISPR/Cas system-associated protein endoribonuclease Cas2
MPKERTQQELVIFKGAKGQVKLKGDFRNDTIWATLDQIAVLFGRDKSVISRHFTNIYKEGELDKNSTVAKNATVQIEGERRVSRDIEFYNLDAIISVGYRVNSKTATQFRQWAIKTLREHITKGFTINPAQIAKNREAFLSAVEQVRKLLPAGGEVGGDAVLDIVQLFADTWFSLDAYDKEELAPRTASKKKVTLTATALQKGIGSLKEVLLKDGSATENFAQERNREALEGIVGNVMQTFGGNALYPTVEGKAAHLLYFIIKNHPFVDGNKRSGAFAFVWFLERAKVLDRDRLTPTALTALTLLIAESNPKDKEKVIDLVTFLIAKR